MGRTLESIGISNVQCCKCLYLALSRHKYLLRLCTLDTQEFYNNLKGMGILNIRIENGMTIISTGDAKGGKKNKNGYTGINYDKRNKKYRAEINYKRQKYHLGYSHSIDELIEIRKEAEYHVKSGEFEDWYRLRKGMRNGKEN